MAVRSPKTLIRPLVRSLQAYVPGEQPKIRGLIKLNTNENPYPPAVAVLKAVRESIDSRLRLYPNPTAELLRLELAKFHRCKPENIIVGNGSDELLSLAIRAFVEPGSRGGKVQYFTPSYSLYPVLADIHGARRWPVPLAADFSLPGERSQWDRKAAVSLVTTPNAPSGRAYATASLRRLCTRQTGVVVLDEAYVDFAENSALSLALALPNVLVARTFSKGYSLCFLRVGYCVGPPDLIEALDKIRDSYNVNGVGQLAALATLKNLPYYRNNFRKIKKTRDETGGTLTSLGFQVFPSQTNFLLVRPPVFPAREWLRKLRESKILVRWFDSAETRDFLRITIGSEKEMKQFLHVVRKILGTKD